MVVNQVCTFALETRKRMKKIFYTLILIALTFGVNAQCISILDQSLVYTEDFNTLSLSGTTQSTLPNGWWVAEAPGNFTYQAGTGSGNTGDTYSFGAASNSERALGGLASNSVVPNFGVRYINNSGSSFSSFFFNLYMEQWRSGGRTSLDSLYFYYSVNNALDSSGYVRINTGTWTRLTSGDMVSKVTQASSTNLNGNLTANRKYYGFSITGVTVNVGDTLYLRWRDPNVSGSDDGLAIDDYSFSVNTPVPVTYKSFNIIQAPDANILKWTTASESNNSHFDIQRSTDGKNFETIGKVKGHGNSMKVNAYQYSDNTYLTAKTIYYRLKQVDYDGKFELSKTISISNTAAKAGISATLPNPFNDELSVTVSSNTATTATIELMDMIGKLHHTAKEQLVAGSNLININTTDMPDGIYFVRLTYNGETFTQKVIKK